MDRTRPTETFSAGYGGRRLSNWLAVLRFQRRSNERLARSAAAQALRIAAAVREQANPYVLDLGCGGRAAVALALNTLGVPAIGIDYDVISPRPSLRDWVSVARRNGAERAAKTIARQLLFDRAYYKVLEIELGRPLRWSALDTQTMDARQLEFGDGTFSFVFSEWVFEHISDIDRAARELARVLRTDGAASVSIHLYPSLSGGHVLEWADADPDRVPSTAPWDHLRDQNHPAHVYLNKHRADDYLAVFSRYLEIDNVRYTMEGRSLLTEAIREQLRDWSVDDLLRRTMTVSLRKRSGAGS